LGIFPDITCAFEFPAFEIVSCPPLDYADLLAKDEVCGDDAEEEGDGLTRRLIIRRKRPLGIMYYFSKPVNLLTIS
jgi:hypothetical protein